MRGSTSALLYKCTSAQVKAEAASGFAIGGASGAAGTTSDEVRSYLRLYNIEIYNNCILYKQLLFIL